MTDNAETVGHGPMSAHYNHLGAQYDDLWEHSTRFREWVCDRILEAAPCPTDAVIADVGGGTGIYADALLNRMPGASVFVIDPAAGMLSHVPTRAGMRIVNVDAEHAPQTLRDLEIPAVDLILVKEAVHHFDDPERTLTSLADMVRPGGHLLVVMLPKTISYPLFAGALERFTALQPNPADISSILTAAGLRTQRHQHSYDLSIPTERWIAMVKNRFMSLLSTFTDDELCAGIAEIERHLAGQDPVTFQDTFEFVCGQRPA